MKDDLTVKMEEELQTLRLKKRRLKEELNNLDTEIIGLKILLDKAKEKADYQLAQSRER